MHRTAARLGPGEAGAELDALERLNPEWRPWLALYRLALRALDDPVWARAVPRPAPDRDRPAGAPLLAGARPALDGRAPRRYVAALLRAAARAGTPEAATLVRVRRGLEPAAFIGAAAAQDGARLAALAAAAGADPDALRAVAELAAWPFLQACGRVLADAVPAAWPHGHCPVCGAWPALAELRGLERARRLRCARCGADWPIPALRCPFCSESHHERLGALLPDGEGRRWRVETCEGCRGYVKCVTTLEAVPSWAVILEDLKTVELDLVALERGYARPGRPGGGA